VTLHTILEMSSGCVENFEIFSGRKERGGEILAFVYYSVTSCGPNYWYGGISDVAQANYKMIPDRQIKGVQLDYRHIGYKLSKSVDGSDGFLEVPALPSVVWKLKAIYM